MKRRRCTVEGCDDRRLFTPMHFGRHVRIRHRPANAANGADHAGTARRLAMGSSTEGEDEGGGDGTSEKEDSGVGGGGDDTGGEEDVGHDLDRGGVGDGGGGGDDTRDLGSVFDEASSSEYDSDASTTTDDISGACVSGGPDDGRTVEMRVADDLHVAAGADRATPVLSDGDLGETLCGKVLDYIDGFGDEEVCRSVFADDAPSDTFAFITPSLRDVFSNTCTMSGARIGAAHRMCLSVERATDATTTPFKNAFPTTASLKTAVRNGKERMLRKLGWMEAVVKTKVGTHRRQTVVLTVSSSARVFTLSKTVFRGPRPSGGSGDLMSVPVLRASITRQMHPTFGQMQTPKTGQMQQHQDCNTRTSIPGPRRQQPRALCARHRSRKEATFQTHPCCKTETYCGTSLMVVHIGPRARMSITCLACAH